MDCLANCGESMNIYAVAWWVPFPSSEYGGLEIYAAKNRKELRRLIEAQGKYDYEKSRWPDWSRLMDKAAREARILATNKPSCLTCFYT